MARTLKGNGISWNVYLPVEQEWLKEEVSKIAAAERRSASEIILRIIEAHLSARGIAKPHPKSDDGSPKR